MGNESLSWGEETPGNLEEGGNLRRPGEAEPNALKARGLSEVEIAARDEMEALEEKESALVAKKLLEEGWRVVDVMGNQKAIDLLDKKINPHGQVNVRYSKLNEILKNLARKEENRRRKFN